MLGQLAKGEPPPSGEAAWGKPELLLRCPKSWTFFLERESQARVPLTPLAEL